MLNFMRRHQRLFFVIVTAMIIVSFSFFGTYQSLFQGNNGKEVAFTTVNGKKVSQRELAQMVLFLSTESTSSGNPLNDGVLTHDLLESGLANVLAAYFQEALEGEIMGKAVHEAHYTPYRHPYATMLGSELIWSSFAPDIKEGLEGLTASSTFEERFSTRTALYLAENAFPPSSLKQMIRYQEGQLKGLPKDRELAMRDLSLFGYHTLEDWFGKSFVTLAAQLIINASVLAEERGYVVSKKEAWADLIHNAELAALRHPTLYAGHGKDTLDGLLRRTGMTPQEASVIWQRVLLFRRLFQDAGSAPLIDTLAFDRFSEYAGETKQIVYYSLPGRYALKNGDDLLSFESYLDAVYDRDLGALAALPTSVKPTQEIKRRAPELVYREYGMRIKSVDQETIAADIPVKEVWNWQLQDDNWESLEARIPTLEKQRGERYAKLKMLDKKSREKADEYARKTLLKAHPERIFAALEVEQAREETLKIPYSGICPLKGLDPKLLMDKLETEDEPFILASDEITYEITPLKNGSEDHVFLYQEAKGCGALRGLSDKRIEEAYQARSDKTKPLSQVRDQVIASLVQSTSKQVYARTKGEDRPDSPTVEYATRMRFVPHLEMVKEERKNEEIEMSGAIHVHAQDPLATQWEVERSPSRITRSQSVQGVSFEELIEGTLSEVYLDTSRGTIFYKVGEKTMGHFDNPLSYDQIQKALSFEAQQGLFREMLEEIEARGGIEVTQGE